MHTYVSYTHSFTEKIAQNEKSCIKIYCKPNRLPQRMLQTPTWGALRAARSQLGAIGKTLCNCLNQMLNPIGGAPTPLAPHIENIGLAHMGRPCLAVG